MKKGVIVILIAILGAISGYAQEQQMSEVDIALFRNKVTVSSKLIQSLTTDFIQYKHMDFLSRDIKTSGNMALDAPGKLRWQYTQPYKYSIVFRNNTIYINDQGNKSSFDAKGNKTFEKINKLIVGSVSGNMLDDKEFSITYLKDSKRYIAKLAPKAPELKKMIREVTLYFPLDASAVSEVKMTEPSGDYTRIVFSNTQLNVKIDPSTFNQ